MEPTNYILNVAYLNCHGQTGFNISKQLQIQEFIKQNRLDIIHLQETFIEEDTFAECNFITSNFTLIKNNSRNKYGTASLIKYCLQVDNIILHESGRIILFDIADLTLGNIYLPSGTDGNTRSSRENFSGETIPTLMINSKPCGIIGGDWNCIIDREDCTKYPESKISPCLRRLVNAFEWKDSFRVIHPEDRTFSRYYSNNRCGEGASRIDRSYFYGDLEPVEARYVPIAFSDHLSYLLSIKLPTPISNKLSPKSRPFFKIRSEIVQDRVFKSRLENSMKEWQEVRDFGVPILTWWEVLVKPGIKKIALERTKEVNRERRSHLNLLMMRQAYLSRKIQQGAISSYNLAALKEAQFRIEGWFSKEVERVKYQSRIDDVQNSEKVRIYHHEIHKKHVKRSAILKLKTSTGTLEGHAACSDFLEKQVEDLLVHPAVLDQVAQGVLLDEIKKVFTETDNEMLTAVPTRVEVEESVKTSNMNAAPGTDGITSFVYKECFNILGDALTEVVRAIHRGQQPTRSQRTSLMLFTSKPGKTSSLKPEDKRRLSMLNTDFKVVTGVEVGRHNKILSHTLCPQQLAAGSDRRITHGICLARDAVYAAGMRKTGCGIADNDFQAAFDFLCLDWVMKVLQKKGMAQAALDRFLNLYNQGITIPVVNNLPGKSLKNKRLSLRQGDRPSEVWYWSIANIPGKETARNSDSLSPYAGFNTTRLGTSSTQPLETRYKV